MTTAQALIQGRELLRKQAWSAAFSWLSDADREAPLEPADLEELSKVARLIGRETEAAELLGRAHQEFLSRGQVQDAARCAENDPLFLRRFGKPIIFTIYLRAVSFAVGPISCQNYYGFSGFRDWSLLTSDGLLHCRVRSSECKIITLELNRCVVETAIRSCSEFVPADSAFHS